VGGVFSTRKWSCALRQLAAVHWWGSLAGRVGITRSPALLRVAVCGSNGAMLNHATAQMNHKLAH